MTVKDIAQCCNGLRETRTMRHHLALATIILSTLAGHAAAQRCRGCAPGASPEDTIVRTHFAPAIGFHFGSPQKASAALGVVRGETWQRGGTDHSRLFALFAEPGLSGGRASLAFLDYGHGNFGSGVGIAATALRTWKDPWTANENMTYGGVEVLLWPIVFVGPRIGMFRSISGTTTKPWFMSFDFGIGL
jgi:hypothetical protein